MNRPTCETCVYWEKQLEESGFCRRRAPRHLICAYSDDNGPPLEEMSDFTTTKYTEWCGEHQLFPKWIELREIDERR